MSSPVQDDQDKRAMYAPPWAREVQERPPESIIAAIEQLREERLRTTAALSRERGDAPARERRMIDPEQEDLPLAERGNAIDIEVAMADAVRSAWRPPSLEPVRMAPPPAASDGPTWGMVGRLSGAVGIAAMVALIATGAVPLPSFDVSSSLDQGAKTAATITQAVGLSDPPANARLQVVDASPAPSAPSVPVAAPVVAVPPAPPPFPSQPVKLPPPSRALPTDVLSAYASLDTSTSAPPQITAKLESAPPLAVAPPPKPPQLRPLERDEIASILKRGQTLLAEGDIASSRLLLRRAAEAGDAVAALTLAGTYDRAELAKLKVIGVAPDPAQAKHWYGKAVEAGSAEAVRRLQQLAQRGD